MPGYEKFTAFCWPHSFLDRASTLERRFSSLVAAVAITSALSNHRPGVLPGVSTPEMLSHESTQGPGIIWNCATADNTGLTAIQFDFIFNVDAIHHFQDRARAFSEIDRLLSSKGTVCIATDSEEIIRNRKPLSTYWPETINLELARYPRIDTLDVELRRASLHSLRQEEVSTTGSLKDLSPYRAKAFSALRLLSEDDYERGLRRLE